MQSIALNWCKTLHGLICLPMCLLSKKNNIMSVACSALLVRRYRLSVIFMPSWARVVLGNTSCACERSTFSSW